MNNPDYKMYPHVYNLIAQKGQHMPPYYHLLVDPYDNEAAVKKSEAEFSQHQGADLHRIGLVRLHVQDPSQRLPALVPQHLQRRRSCCWLGRRMSSGPIHTFHGEVLRWNDHWLKGIDTGITEEPPVKYWVMGANEWRTASDWPVPETQWTKLYLSSWERLTPDTPAAVERERDPAAGCLRPDAADADQHDPASALHDRSAAPRRSGGGPDRR